MIPSPTPRRSSRHDLPYTPPWRQGAETPDAPPVSLWFHQLRDGLPVPVIPAPRPRKRWPGVVAVLAIVVGLLLAVAGLTAPTLPIPGANGYSLSDAHGLCQSALGQLASAADQDTHTNCTRIGWLYTACWLFAAAGVLVALSGAAGLWQRRTRYR